MFNKSVVKKNRSVIFFSVLLVSFCALGVVTQQYVSSSRVVLKDELNIHRKLLHDAGTDHACDCYSPFITNFTVSKITASGADISWACDAPSTYQVRWGTTTTGQALFPTTTPTASYKQYTVTLTGLKAKTLYHVGPSSICMSSCTRNDISGINGKRKTVDTNKKGDWTFTTLDNTSVVVEQNESELTSVSETKVAEITAQEVTITWKSNKPATSLIEYGLTSSYGLKTEQNTIAERNHTIQLFDLRLGTTYHARAVSKDPATGKTVYSSDFTFTTPLKETRIVNPETVINEPNPCFNRTMFVYYLYQPVKRMTIDIFTLTGKTVATLEAPKGTLNEGYNKVMWDLKDNAQKSVANGLYVYTMKFYLADNQFKQISRSNLMIKR